MVEILEKYFGSAQLASAGAEVSCLCPKCAPLKRNRRHTLYFSTTAFLFICFRCGYSGAGRNQFRNIFGFDPVELVRYYEGLTSENNQVYTDIEKTKVNKYFYYQKKFTEGKPLNPETFAYPVVRHMLEVRRVSSVVLQYMSDRGYLRVIDEHTVAFGDNLENIQFYNPEKNPKYMSYFKGTVPLFFMKAARYSTIYLFEGVFDMLPHATEVKGVGMAVLCGKNRLPEATLVKDLNVQKLVFCFDRDVELGEYLSVLNQYKGICEVGFLPPPEPYKDWGECPESLETHLPFFAKSEIELMRYYLTKKEKCNLLSTF